MRAQTPPQSIGHERSSQVELSNFFLNEALNPGSPIGWDEFQFRIRGNRKFSSAWQFALAAEMAEEERLSSPFQSIRLA